MFGVMFGGWPGKRREKSWKSRVFALRLDNNQTSFNCIQHRIVNFDSSFIRNTLQPRSSLPGFFVFRLTHRTFPGLIAETSVVQLSIGATQAQLKLDKPPAEK